MHARWWQHTTVADGWIVREMDGGDGMKRHRRRETRTDVGRAGLVLKALLFPQVGLKRNRWRYKGTGRQLSRTDRRCYHPQTRTQQTISGGVHTIKTLRCWSVSVSVPPPVSKITCSLEDRSLNDLLHLERQQLDLLLITGHEDFVCCISEGALLKLPGCVCVCVNGFERLN